MKRKLFIYVFLFLAVVAVDGVLFLTVEGPNIISWRSIIHPAWVIVAVSLLGIGALVWRRWMWQTLFILYFAMFVAALLNQYLSFTEVLTYNCMLFNLIFVTLYYFLGGQNKS